MFIRSSLLVLAATGALTTAALQQDPREVADNSWISLTGEVKGSMTEAFTLDYGDGVIIVEMDDWDWYDEANQIIPGERVTVYGLIDDGLYEARTIEADSVYVFDRNTFFYANDVDEEGDYFAFPYFVYGTLTLPDGTWLTVSGEVEKIDGREFTIDNGFRTITIDTDEMPYNPMDDVGFQKVKAGDRVSVTGTMDVDFFEKDEIKASTLVTLSRDKTKKSKFKSKGKAKNKAKSTEG